MAPKRASSKSCDDKKKQRRKIFTIQEKMKLLDMITEGKKIVEVARYYNLNESTVRAIQRDEKNIRATAAISLNKEAKRVVTNRNKFLMKMESVLAAWINDSREENISLNSVDIRKKARQIYHSFMVDEAQLRSSATNIDFVASKGWYERFKKRFNLKNVSLHKQGVSADQPVQDNNSRPEEEDYCRLVEEDSLRPAGEDYCRPAEDVFCTPTEEDYCKPAVTDYVNHSFHKILVEGEYYPEQVFNMNRTELFWKRMPSRTYIFKNEVKLHGFTSHKDRVSVIMCGNAEGFLLKPALIYKAKNPRALKNKNKNLLPVHWMHNNKGLITKELLSDWFYDCFIPQVKQYLTEQGFEFNILLLFDIAGPHAQDLSYEGVRIEFLPPNIAPLIEPMDQGVIHTFKALYTQYSLQHLVESMDHDRNFSLEKCWQQFNVATCLKNIQAALNDLKMQIVKTSWKKLWPGIVYDCSGFTLEDVSNAAIDKAIKLAQLLGGEGFSDMTRKDVNELLESHSNPLTDDDLVEMIKAANEEEVVPGDQGEKIGLTVERITQVVRTIKEVQDMIGEWDPEMMRALQFRNALDGALEPYTCLLTHMKRKLSSSPSVEVPTENNTQPEDSLTEIMLTEEQ